MFAAFQCIDFIIRYYRTPAVIAVSCTKSSLWVRNHRMILSIDYFCHLRRIFRCIILIITIFYGFFCPRTRYHSCYGQPYKQYFFHGYIDFVVYFFSLKAPFQHFIPNSQSEKTNNNADSDNHIGEFGIEFKLLGDDTGHYQSRHSRFKNCDFY